MAPMLRKRKRASEGHGEPVQRKRPAKRASKEITQLKDRLSSGLLEANTHRAIEDMNNAYDDVEECLIFSNITDPGARVSELTVGIREDVEAMRKRWLSLITDLDEHIRWVKKAGAQLQKAVFAQPAWYLNSNVLEIPYERLVEAFGRTDIGDGRDFSQYLHSLLFSLVLDKDNLNDEASEDFSKNALFLVKLLGKPKKPSTDFHYFHALVLLAAETFRPERWCDDIYIVIDNIPRVTDLVLECLKRASNVPKHQPRASLRYWNCARARRELWKTWQAIRCDDFDWGYLGGAGGAEGDGDCWHLHCRDMMEAIQTQALAEVHSNVLLAVGTKLPQELTDQIVQLAMAAEECPTDPHVCTSKANENPTTYTEGHFGEYRFTRSDQPCTCELRSRTSFGAAPARLRAKRARSR